MNLMNKLVYPATYIMGNLRYPAKFGLILFLFMLSVITVSSLVVNNVTENIRLLEQRQRGVEYILALRNLLESIPQHRGMTNAYLHGDRKFREKLQEKREEIDNQIRHLTTLDERLNPYLKSSARVSQFRQHWEHIKSNTLDLSAEKAFAMHNRLIEELVGFIRYVADISGLVLDQALDTYYLADTISNRLPKLVEAIGQARGFAAGAATSDIGIEDTIKLHVLLSRIRIDHYRLSEGLNQVFAANDEIQNQLNNMLQTSDDNIQAFINTVERDVLSPGTVQLRGTHIFESGTQALSAVFRLYDHSMPALDHLYNSRKHDDMETKYAVIGAMCAVLLLLSYLFTGFYVSVRSSVSRLADSSARLAQGKLDSRVKINTRDEMSTIADAFNAMAEKLEAGQLAQQAQQAREREQEEELQRAADFRNRIELFRQHVEKVAQGDLTSLIEVGGDDDLSQLGDYLNRMTENLGNMTGQIHDVTNIMLTTISELDAAVSNQTSGVSEQAASVNQTTSTLEEIRQTSAQTLDKAKMLGESAQRTREESEQGLVAVQQAIEGMNTIREQVNDIARTILALSEQTQQIGEITTVVSDLAHQSKMLALNASIEAAKAGDAGKGFAVVADEVKDLAEQSQQSTAQVQKILQDIRHATDRAVMTTEEGTKGVDTGVGLVERSGEIMNQLSEVIHDTLKASQQIVAAVRQESAGIDQVNTAMTEINKVTQQFVSTAKQTAQAAEDIGKLADNLKHSVSAYQIRKSVQNRSTGEGHASHQDVPRTEPLAAS